MKQKISTLAIVADALLVGSFWLTIAVLVSTTGLTGEMNRHIMEYGPNLAGILHVFPTLATSTIGTAKILLITFSLGFLSIQAIASSKLFKRLSMSGLHS